MVGAGIVLNAGSPVVWQFSKHWFMNGGGPGRQVILDGIVPILKTGPNKTGHKRQPNDFIMT
jgi:hypothetical protein